MTVPPVKSAQRELWNALWFYNAYRMFLVIIVLAMLLLKSSLLEPGISNPVFYRSIVLAYFVLVSISFLLWYRRWLPLNTQTFFAVTADFIVLVLFIRSSGGVGHSAAEMLLFVPVAASGALLSGRMALLLVSIAVLVLLHQASLSVLSAAQDDSLFMHVGFLGVALMVTAIVVNQLAVRAKKSEKLVRLHAANLRDLGSISEFIIQTMDSGVLVLDADNAPLFMNNRARDLLGVEGADISGRRLSDISVRLDAEFQQWNTISEKQNAFTCDKTHKVIQPTFSELANDRNLGSLIMIEEIGEARRRAQQAKLAALGRLTGSIAHEIRNPLSAISQAAQLLTEGAPQDRQPRLVQLIGNNTARIDRIVEDVMSLNKSDQINREYIKLPAWLEKFVGRYIRERNLDMSAIRLDLIDESALFDSAHLERVMRNLLENGIQHGDAEQLPVIDISVLTGNDSMVFVDIHDNGPGVDESLIETIFEPFFTKRPDGTGLGLYISRELCETNGGYLEYMPDKSGKTGFFRITMEKAGA